jgi:hypothetical protein
MNYRHMRKLEECLLENLSRTAEAINKASTILREEYGIIEERKLLAETLDEQRVILSECIVMLLEIDKGVSDGSV